MGKGGPMAFLNKKTWHPGRVQNQEEVWKREQEASKEDQKMKDLQKQIAEERAREEMMQVAEAAGVKVRSDRLDWMYQGGVGARQEADQRHETAAGAGAPTDTAKTAREEQEDAFKGRAGAVAALPSFYSEDTPASANEMWQRLHADPLFAIKQQEVSARRTILNNPVQMQAIKSQVKQLKGGRGDDSDGDGERRHRRHDRKKDKKRKKDRRDRSRSRSPSRREKSRRGGRDEGRDRDDSRKEKKSRSRSRSRSPRRHRHHRDDSRDRRDTHHHRRKHSRRSRSRSPEDRYKRQERPSRREEGREWSRERERGSSRRDAEDTRRVNDSRQHSPPNDKNKINNEEERRPEVHMDSASAQGAGAQYGITYGRHVPDAVRNQDRSHLGEATRKRLEEAAQRKKEEEREAAAERNRQRRANQHRPGKLTEEERQRRLQEMTAAANEHDAQRNARIEEYEKVEAKEAADQQGRDHNDTATFLQAATKDVYGAGGDGGGTGGSLADAVGRRKAFQQRGGEGGGSAFRK